MSIQNAKSQSTTQACQVQMDQIRQISRPKYAKY